MKTIIQVFSVAVAFISCMSVVVFGAAWGMDNYPDYGGAFMIIAMFSAIVTIALAGLVLYKIDTKEICN